MKKPDIPFLFWNTSTTIEIAGGQKTRVRNCNGFEATNIGDVIVWINGQVLYPGVPGTSNGDSKTWGGNYAEIYLGNIQVVFDANTAGTNPQVQITQKFYTIDGNIINNG